MKVVMRIIQEFIPEHESEFMALEQKFFELENLRDDFPDGKRMQPVSSAVPVNSLIWEGEFPDIETAYKTLNFFDKDEAHGVLFKQQVKFMNNVKVEFYNVLDF